MYIWQFKQNFQNQKQSILLTHGAIKKVLRYLKITLLTIAFNSIAIKSIVAFTFRFKWRIIRTCCIFMTYFKRTRFFFFILKSILESYLNSLHFKNKNGANLLQKELKKWLQWQEYRKRQFRIQWKFSLIILYFHVRV